MSNEPETLMINCGSCSSDLYNIIIKTGSQSRPLISCGKCRDCGIDFCINCLRTNDGLTENSWAVVYKGYSCNQCWESE